MKHRLGVPREDPRPAVQDHRLHRARQARQPEGDAGPGPAAEVAAPHAAGDALCLVKLREFKIREIVRFPGDSGAREFQMPKISLVIHDY